MFLISSATFIFTVVTRIWRSKVFCEWFQGVYLHLNSEGTTLKIMGTNVEQVYHECVQ